MVFAMARGASRCGASRGARDAVGKHWQAAVPVVHAARRRASESLDDTPHRLRLPSYPTGRMDDPYGSLSPLLGISRHLNHGAVVARSRKREDTKAIGCSGRRQIRLPRSTTTCCKKTRTCFSVPLRLRGSSLAQDQIADRGEEGMVPIAQGVHDREMMQPGHFDHQRPQARGPPGGNEFRLLAK